ncbi:hypothetical protein [Natronomonas sp.]|uniref:hypothetical protein n=1 Tax=Natronomonas sp. TaxID=2184060 RepID=UPI0026359F97|nr:hypothetical protein [Natronomonas sp.]
MIDSAGVSERDAAVWGVAVVLLASLGGAVLVAGPLSEADAGESREPTLVAPAEGGTDLWPYTASERRYETRTLGINMVFYADQADVRTALVERSAVEWRDEQVHEGDADAATVSHERVRIDPDADSIPETLSWSDAEGSTRYTYLRADGGGRWVEESYQLHAGTYLGQRRHVRAYGDPAGEWTAVQIHGEHWDWFRLRHTVTGVSEPQRDLEREFLDDPGVERVVRIPFGNERLDGDGWASGVHFDGVAAPALLTLLVVGRTDLPRVASRIVAHRREIALAGGIFGIHTAVRWIGVATERLLPSVSPTLIAVPLYVALVVGVPVTAHLLARGSGRTRAFGLAALGLGAAIVADFAAMGVSAIPIETVLHRLSVLLAVGSIAAGSVERPDRPALLAVGVGGWALAVAASLFGLV